MKIKEIELSTLLTLAGIIAMGAGFVYTAEYRLAAIEQRLEQAEESQKKLGKKINKLNKKK